MEVDEPWIVHHLGVVAGLDHLVKDKIDDATAGGNGRPGIGTTIAKTRR